MKQQTVNYPMFESFKHFQSFPDLEYNNYIVRKEECTNYKRYVDNISVIKHFQDITEEKLSIIIYQNLKKYAFLSFKDISNYNLYLNNFSQENLLHIQQKLLKNNGIIQVINTSVFWGIDYFGEKKYNEYINLSE